jgi:sulfide:quinone oxidoreductase
LPEGKRIVVLGAGFGGLASANLLRKGLSEEHQITVIDRKNHFLMGFVNLWILNGDRSLEESKTALSNLKSRGISFLQEEVTAINPVEKNVTTVSSPSSPSSPSTTAGQGHKHEYDYLVMALGAEYAPEQIDGFAENGGFNLYDAEQIPKLRKEILSLRRGRIALCITKFPYKCPPAPYEASMLVNEILIKNGTRENVDIDVYTPSPIALPVAGPGVSNDVVSLLDKNRIRFRPSHRLKSVSVEQLCFECDGDGGTWEKNVGYDLLMAIPPHKLSPVIKSSGFIMDGQKWVEVDRFSLKTKYENAYAIGDVTEIRVNQNVSIPKAGIFAEGQAKVVCQQILNDIMENQSGAPLFDGKGFCFMEVGNNKAGFIDTNFYNEEGPITKLEPPSEESYRKKVDFEKSRVGEWLLSSY